ncbi:carbohydrate kinase [Streptomyces sp. AJS327]|uniref:carbohydrate kinase family protein n=1 Tax=Streptomyces sp. AJS327 TaxID=2545265 RepID=UPI0015DF88F5|nr:carbohydrate kinase [Streptomyces sp. AJS327]MBA0052749.1 carbohydrate kinase [Streptomyces sp. AJS327]
MIVVAGEALIDLVPEGEAAEEGGLPVLRSVRGGGPYNTAVALARLETPTAFCSRVSTDGFGERLLDGLRENGVDTALVQRGAEPTTLALADVHPDGSAAYRFYVEGTADRLFTLPTEVPEDTSALVFGTCSLVLEPGASAYEALLRREFARGVFTVLDPNIRAGLISDPDTYRARFRSWLPSVSLVKLSLEDARWLADADGIGDVLRAAGEWLAAGPAALVLTQGGDGLTVFTRDHQIAVPGEPVAVVDTIGAGDTVNAALLHRLSEHGALSHRALGKLTQQQWLDVLDFAARAAAVTCSRAGARPPSAAELRR